MTKKETLQFHKRMWEIIANNIINGKCLSEVVGEQKYVALREMLYKKEIDTFPKNYCFCCHYASILNKGCKECPIKWTGGHCCEINSEYHSFKIALENHNFETATNLAFKISFLSEK